MKNLREAFICFLVVACMFGVVAKSMEPVKTDHHYKFRVTQHFDREMNNEYLTDSVMIELGGVFHFTDSNGVERWMSGDIDIENNKEK